MLEMLFGDGNAIGLVETGPGPKRLLSTYRKPSDASKITGYYGTLTTQELINGPALAGQIGAVTTLGEDVELWFKMYIDGKVLFIPKRPASNSIGWQRIYNAGAVYGHGGLGIRYSGTGVVQNKTLTLQGYLFKLRLLTGYNTTPESVVNISTGANPIPTDNSEWSRLMYNLCSDAGAVAVRQGPAYGPGYPYSELSSVEAGKGVFNYSSSPVTAAGGGGVGCRGNLASGVTYGSYTQVYDDRASGTLAWRPILELIGPV